MRGWEDILKLILGKYVEIVYTPILFIWLRIGTGGWFL
jgi:hypothetical protein